MPLRLIIEDDEGSTTVVPLASDAITIGRQQGNTIQLTEKNVSRRHARLYPEADGWVIEDLGSYNGIKVNNDAVDGRTRLREGDVVEIGDYHLAITEDVDKSPLNFRTGQAANDGVVEPMLVSSSADLPRLSPEEIAALQSGQQPISVPPRGGMMADSGPMPAGHYHPGYAEPERSKKTGLYVFLGIVVLGVAALAVFWVITQKEDGGGSGEVAAGGSKTPGDKTEPAKAIVPPTDDGQGANADGADPDPVPSSADGGTPDLADGGAPDAADDGATPDAADGGEPVVDDGEPSDEGSDEGEPVEVVDDEPTEPKQPKQPRPKQPKQPKQTKPDPKPAVDATALLEEARQKQWKDPAAGYRLAKQSYGAKPSSDALWVMGPAACRMKDRSKVEWVLKRLKGADKTKLTDMCAQKGFPL